MKNIKANFNCISFVLLIIIITANMLIIGLDGYIFIPVNNFLFFSLYMVFMSVICILSVKLRNEQTKVSRFFGVSMQLVCFLLAYSVLCVLKQMDMGTSNKNLALLMFCSIFVIGAIMTIVNISNKMARIICIIVNIIVIFVLVLFLLFAYMVVNFGLDTVLQEYPSPDGVYNACLVDSNQGATGGSTYIFVRETEEINLIIGSLIKEGKVVWSGLWNKLPTVKWQDNDTLIVNDEVYNLN